MTVHKRYDVSTTGLFVQQLCDANIKTRMGTCYHHPRCQQFVLSWNLIISKGQCDVTEEVSITQITVFYTLCNIPILQPFQMIVKCCLVRSWKPKVKPNLGCHNNIPINEPYILVFVSSWYFENGHSYVRVSINSSWQPCEVPLFKTFLSLCVTEIIITIFAFIA